MPVLNCRPAAPVRRMPTRKAAGIVASGLARASSAMVMPSKPSVPTMAGSKRCSVPSASSAPPSPARPAPSAMTSTMIREIEMPA